MCINRFQYFLQNGMNAVSMNVAEQYVQAFGNIAKEGNTVVLPMNSGDVSGVVTQVRYWFSFTSLLSHLLDHQ